MRIGKLAFFVDTPYMKDKLFDRNSPLNRDNGFDPYIMLKESIEKQGGMCHTYDKYIESEIIPDVVLFIDIPIVDIDIILGQYHNRVKKWVILFECEVVKPHNWERCRHEKFDKIFTWKDSLCNGSSYVKLNFPNIFQTPILKGDYDIRKFCTMISGNKHSEHPMELYSKRIEAIRWFESNHPNDFDLYGIGWNKAYFKEVGLLKLFSKLPFFRRYIGLHFSSYKGMVVDKLSTLREYKFAICYENAQKIEGYITEKIFDCFFSGCIPIYWGPDNITEYIPSKCFIDRRNFANYEELYLYLKAMDEERYNEYLTNIVNYLKSQYGQLYTAGYFVKTILKELGG